MEAAVEVASNLRTDDYREVWEGHGHFPRWYIPFAAFNGDTVYFNVPNGKTAGLAGVQEGGKIWMLCTPAIHDYPLTFAREAKRFIESREEKLLWNIVDKRNTAHLKLLKFLGFKFLKSNQKLMLIIQANTWVISATNQRGMTYFCHYTTNMGYGL